MTIHSIKPCAPAGSLRPATGQAPPTSPLIRTKKLIHTHMEGLRSEHPARDSGSVERLSASLLAAIAWIDRTGLLADPKESQRIAYDLERYLKQVCEDEDASSAAIHDLANGIVGACQEGRNQATLTDAAATLTAIVLEENEKVEPDARHLLRTIMSESPLANISDPQASALLYRYSVTAWAQLGPEAERPARQFLAEKILTRPGTDFRDPLNGSEPMNAPGLPDSWIEIQSMPDGGFELAVADAGLTSLPALTDECIKIVAIGNKLSGLPKLPANLTILNVDQNRLTRLRTLPIGLKCLQASENQLIELPKLPAHLIILDVSVNELITLADLPERIEQVDVSHNRLTMLPEVLGRLKALCVTGNKLKNLPASILSLAQDAEVEIDDNLPAEVDKWLRDAIKEGRVGPKINFHRSNPSPRPDSFTWTSWEQPTP